METRAFDRWSYFKLTTIMKKKLRKLLFGIAIVSFLSILLGIGFGLAKYDYITCIISGFILFAGTLMTLGLTYSTVTESENEQHKKD